MAEMMRLRDMSKQVTIGGLTIGGGSPILVQSMTNTDTLDLEATYAQKAGQQYLC